MLVSYGVKGFKTFSNYVEINFKADNYIKTNKDLYFDNNEFGNYLKSALIYGPNNTGKSCLIKSLEILKKIVLEKRLNEDTILRFYFNMFSTKEEILYKISFIENNDLFNYELLFDSKNVIKKEKLMVNNKEIFDRNKVSDDNELNSVINLIKQDDSDLIVTMLPQKYNNYSKSFISFFSKLLIVKNHFPYEEVINDFKTFNKEEQSKFIKVMQNADVNIKGVKFHDEEIEDLKLSNILRLFSKYTMNNKSMELPSFIVDSDGTKVYSHYIEKIILALRNGGTIVIDEIDSSLHTLLTKSIIAIFNNEDNKNIQLLATTHDLQLLDCKYLFRKDQIWFTYKDEKEIYLYSLNEFKAAKDPQIRRTDLVNNYLKGMFGSLPHPDVEDFLLHNDK